MTQCMCHERLLTRSALERMEVAEETFRHNAQSDNPCYLERNPERREREILKKLQTAHRQRAALIGRLRRASRLFYLRHFRRNRRRSKQAAAASHAARKELCAHNRKIVFPSRQFFLLPRRVPHCRPSMLFSSRRTLLSDTQDTKRPLRRLRVDR